MTNNDLDSLVDAVARHMTDADPPVDLRDRVLARLDGRASSPWIWIWKVIPSTAVLLAVMLIAVVLVRRPQSPTQSTTLQTPAAVTPELSREADSRTNDGPSVATGVAPIGAAATQHAIRTTTSRISDVEAEWRARALPLLSPPEALTMDGIQPDALAIRPLETRPLVIAPIGADQDRF